MPVAFVIMTSAINFAASSPKYFTIPKKQSLANFDDKQNLLME